MPANISLRVETDSSDNDNCLLNYSSKTTSTYFTTILITTIKSFTVQAPVGEGEFYSRIQQLWLQTKIFQILAKFYNGYSQNLEKISLA